MVYTLDDMNQPSVRLDGANADIAQVGQDHWLVDLGQPGLTCSMERLADGSYGERLFRIELANTGGSEIDAPLLPPFCEWTDDATLMSASTEHMYMHGPTACLGGIGRLLTHQAGAPFGAEQFVTVPSGDGQYIAAVLIRMSGDAKLAAGGAAVYHLHVDSGKGGRNDALRETYRVRGGYLVDPSTYDFSQYENPKTQWMKDIVSMWFNWSWDKANLDPRTGEYRLAESVVEWKRKMGGFDAYLYWPFWPRAGFDSRQQFDHFRDMPGGLEGLRDEFARVQELGTRIVAAYCFWSESDLVGPERWADGEAQKSFEEYVEVACAIGADGACLDCMSTTPDELLRLSREKGRELLPYNEGDPGWAESQVNLIGRIHNGSPMPQFSFKRYMLPHHPVLRACESGRGDKCYRNGFVLSFFNGHGVEIQTIWPDEHPANEAETPTLARLVDILRTNRANFTSPDWETFVESLDSKVWVNRWPAEGKTIYTLCGTDPGGHLGDLLRVPNHPDVHYVDLWRYRQIDRRAEGDDVVLSYRVEGYSPGLGSPTATADYSPGCIGVFPKLISAELDLEILTIELDNPGDGWALEVWNGTVDPGAEPVRVSARKRVDINLYEAFGYTNQAIVIRLLDNKGQLMDVHIVPEALARFFNAVEFKRTEPVDPQNVPEGMVRIPGGKYGYVIEQSQPLWQPTYLDMDRGYYQAAPASTPREVEVAPFLMDRYPVTNAQFAEFVSETCYLQGPDVSPVAKHSFLKHWIDGRVPEGLEDHPVVYVSHDDALAYAHWAAKRLPTEEEWQFAAGAADGLLYPWGSELEPDRCNSGGVGTTPVDAYPQGASPFGVEDMVGNVWQWTYRLFDTGRHEIVFVRGGCWRREPDGCWWVHGGPRRINDHHPLPLCGPGLNRFATVGFRCVKDV